MKFLIKTTGWKSVSNYRYSKQDFLSHIDSGKKAIKRGGSIIFDLLKKESKYLTGEEASQIADIYGLRAFELTLLLSSHGFEFDEECYSEIRAKDVERSLNMRQCNV